MDYGIANKISECRYGVRWDAIANSVNRNSVTSV